MPYEGLSNLHLLAEANNYNAWLFDAVRPFVGKRVLEIGAGIGTFTALLQEQEHVTATDMDEACLAELTSRFPRSGSVEVMRLNITEISREQREMLLQKNFDTIIGLNVLEHIRDDILALKNLRLLVSSGRLLLIVPALRVLYGVEDEAVGHFRRYTKRELVKKLSGAGWHVEKVGYMNSLGAVLWFIKNRIMKSPATSPGNVLIYDKLIVPFLSRMERIIPVPFGQSLVAISSAAGSGSKKGVRL
jgi:2-polyprenyl-3-methyl-5-hydroxy-6-metoxy-1,4-benzoquinol methylase